MPHLLSVNNAFQAQAPRNPSVINFSCFMNEYQVLAHYKHNIAAMQMNILALWH